MGIKGKGPNGEESDQSSLLEYRFSFLSFFLTSVRSRRFKLAIMSKAVVLILSVVATAVLATSLQRAKRQAGYELPDGAELLLGSIRSTFQCPPQDGYYADVDNNCQIFHVCHTDAHADGTSETRLFSFLCGNQTVFNQYSLSCATEEESIPCAASQDFFNLNTRIGDEKALLHDDNDVAKAAQLVASRRSGK